MANHAATTLGSMKTLLLTLGMAAALVSCSYAAEYVTLFNGDSKEINAESIVETVGWKSMTYQSDHQIRLVFVKSNTGEEFERDIYSNPGVMTGLKRISILGNSGFFVTLKITHANEINAVAPTSVLVIPENSTGNYNIVVETSSDTATWTPFHSQTVSANDAKRFFRTRIVKAE